MCSRTAPRWNSRIIPPPSRHVTNPISASDLTAEKQRSRLRRAISAGSGVERLGGAVKVTPQHGHGAGDLVDCHPLVAGMRQVGIAGPVVDGGDAPGGE